MKRVEVENTVTYIIDEDARMIKAIIRDVKYDALNSLIKTCEGISIGFTELSEDVYLNSTYTGTAFCCEQDNFDVEIGKAIARKRAIVKYNKAKIKRLQDVFACIDKMHTNLSKTIAYHEQKLDKISNEVKVLEDKYE